MCGCVKSTLAIFSYISFIGILSGCSIYKCLLINSTVVIECLDTYCYERSSPEDFFERFLTALLRVIAIIALNRRACKAT